MKTRTRNVVCWVERGFDALDVAGLCQVLSEAGSTWNWRAYRLELASERGGLITSSAQYDVQTIPLTECSLPEVVIMSGGAPFTAPASAEDPTQLWQQPEIEWVGLRNGLVPLLATGRYSNATVAANPRAQARLLAAEPRLGFSACPWHRDGRLWSCASSDTTEMALALVQHHVGMSARRAIETALGLTTAFPSIRVELPHPKPDSES